ncbi:hypothetical protein [[Clostridium] fimetarium]|uniref:Uncharacterized protein n=1 Tax=[Clostridium] fimetarium TaxID=99656 RepID=A0A1I0RDW3_9FIRM|nr:hypothetical protein [[Clostridium] fimetarium]SEW38852.1 hypothetical protein SAMN05421659_11451 [[Clostridium] fimetarium]
MRKWFDKKKVHVKDGLCDKGFSIQDFKNGINYLLAMGFLFSLVSIVELLFNLFSSSKKIVNFTEEDIKQIIQWKDSSVSQSRSVADIFLTLGIVIVGWIAFFLVYAIGICISSYIKDRIELNGVSDRLELFTLGRLSFDENGALKVYRDSDGTIKKRLIYSDLIVLVLLVIFLIMLIAVGIFCEVI